jgi:DNA-binding transcriptional LysR family regulator
VSAKALAAFPLALPGPGGGLRKDFELRVRNAGGGVLLRPVIEGPWAILLRYVEEGFAVGLLPRSVVKSSEKTLATRGLAREVTPVNAVRLICRKRFGPDPGLDLTPAGTAFLAALNEAKKPYLKE